MQVYMAAMEGNIKHILENNEDDEVEFALISYYYIKDNDEKLAQICAKCKHILVDSGAHSFQHGIKVDFEEYTRAYAKFIRKNTNNPKIIGFFEMDVDNVIGYEKVLELRAILEAESDKIIPVWHNNRGVDDFIDMCKKYSGRRISITGFGFDVQESQYNLFINTAHKYGCNIHILGFTRLALLQNLNMGLNDSVDSSSWVQAGIFGRIKMLNKDGTLYEFGFPKGMKISQFIIRKLNFITYNNVARWYKDIDNSV